MGIAGFVARKAAQRVVGGKIRKPSKASALIRLPSLLKIAMALLTDDRVPVWQKATVLSLVGLIVSPFDLPGDIPVIGQMWDFTLIVVVLDLWIQNAPADVVNDHIMRLGLEKTFPMR